MKPKKKTVKKKPIKKKKTTKKVTKKTKINKEKAIIIALIIIDVFVCSCFFLFYGSKKFKTFIITTAMTTKSHKFLAKTFYSDKTIEKILSQNSVLSFETGSDATQVKIGGFDQTNYASSYEKDILEHNENEDYKLIRFEYNGYDAFIVAIYDPKRVSLVQSAYIGSRGQVLTEMAQTYDAIAMINAGGFRDIDAAGNVGYGNGGIAEGVVIKDGKVVSGNGYANTELAGFNNDGILQLSYTNANDAIANGMKDAVQFGPFLIVNGVSATINGNGGWGVNPRTVLAQRKDGVVLFLVVDGNGVNNYNWSGRGGVTMNELVEILERYGAYNAVNMDGGASTTLVVNKELLNHPCGYNSATRHQRALPNAWMFK